MNPSALLKKASFFGLLLISLFSPFTQPIEAAESSLSFVSRYGQQSEDRMEEHFFWNRLRYDQSMEVGDSCYAEGAYELIPYWLKKGLLLRDQTSIRNVLSRIYRVNDLQHRLSGKDQPSLGPETLLEQDLDRLLMSCTFGIWDLVLGRQPISFGASQSFNPTDLFAPVSFKPLDGEFRAGSDALRVRSWLSNTAELDFGILAGFGKNPGNNGSFIRVHMLMGEVDFTPMVASFGNNFLFGMSLQAAMGYWGVVFDGALVALGENNTGLSEDQKTRWLPWTFGINLQVTGDLFFSLEYHRNPMGTKNPEAYASIMLQPIYVHYPVTLMGQEYVISSLHYKLSPLWSLNFSSMTNQNDVSSLILNELDWNVTEDWWLKGGSRISLGNHQRGKSEFVTVADQYSLSLRYYR